MKDPMTPNTMVIRIDMSCRPGTTRRARAPAINTTTAERDLIWLTRGTAPAVARDRNEALIVVEMGSRDVVNSKNNAGDTPGYHGTAACSIR
jgi:hypothetical protein